MTRTPIKITEIRTEQHCLDVLALAKANHQECAPHLPFKDDSVVATCLGIINDIDRASVNCWIAYEGEKPVGYGVGVCTKFFFNDNIQANMEIWFVVPECRGSWAAIKLVKKYEEWARLNSAYQIYVGVARLLEDETKHIRRLFPRLGYKWCGSNYLKEPF